MSPFPSDDLVDTPPPPKERRFKLSRACDRCRRRRIKCDEGHPCQSCLSSHSPCTFEEPGKRAPHSKSKRTSSLEDRMLHLETLIQSIPAGIFESVFHRNGVDAGHTLPDASQPPLQFSGPDSYPPGVPPPSLTVSPLMNPSIHFPTSTFPVSFATAFGSGTVEQQPTSRLSLSHSYMYFDEQGCKRWQGETSGLPLLDLLFDRGSCAASPASATPPADSPSCQEERTEWFPDRVASHAEINPETLWKVITSCISPDLMDTLVQCYLSTSYYLMPFLHVPTFLADYGNPVKWGEPGFASFILAICCLSSRHLDDPRVRSDASDPSSVGSRWFDLFSRLRTLPTADKPTLYTVQSVLVAAVYAVGLGKLSKAFALLSEAVTLSFDAGLHRSVDAYDCFDAVEDEVRKRTFWCVYLWDKQAGAAFGRPPLLRLRDCDVPEPAVVDDEFISPDGIGTQPVGTPSRMGAFVAALRYHIVLESILDLPPSINASYSPFLTRAAAILSGFRRDAHMREEEMIIDELRRTLPRHWAHTPETLASEDVIRVTQAVRLHCLERSIVLLIHRHRFSNLVAQRTLGSGACAETEPSVQETECMKACFTCSREIVGAYLHTASKGLMTYYGVHVIHQLTQAGRTLLAVVLSAKKCGLQALIPPSLEALRSCVHLLRRFSGRYVCGLRNGDLLEEFCRLSQIPLDACADNNNNNNNKADASQSRPPWLRPVKKRHQTPSAPRSTNGSSSSDLQHDNNNNSNLVDHHIDHLGNSNSLASPTHSHTSADDPFLSAAPTTDVDVDLQHFGPPPAPAPRSPRPESGATPHDMFHDGVGVGGGGGGGPSAAGISPNDLVTLLNENSFDLSTLFQSSSAAGMDMFTTMTNSNNGRDLGIIATP